MGSPEKCAMRKYILIFPLLARFYFSVKKSVDDKINLVWLNNIKMDCII